jgi:RNA polymerase sigma factor (sigma-70 family)
VAKRRTGPPRAHDSEEASSDPAGSLLVRALTDPEAFGEFYDRYHVILLGWFLHRTGSPHLAAELTAETFAQTLASLEQYDPARGSGTTWLFGIAGHQFHGFLRRGDIERRHRRHLHLITPDLRVDELDRVVDRLDAEVRVPELANALNDLSEALRSAVLLRIGADLPYPEVAARLGCTEGTARARVARGLRQLVALMVPT